MSRYYNGYSRRRYSGSYWGTQHVSERNQLSAITGGIDKDIEQIFLNLPSYKLQSVLRKYGKEHGASALTYAKKTYPNWKARKVKMSGKVAERLLNLVPTVLDSDAKFELVKKVRNAHRRKLTKHVQCEPHEWRTKVAPEVSALLATSSEFELPTSAINRIQWLADGDSQSAQRLLAAAEEEEAIARLQHLEREFQRIDVFLNNVQGQKIIRHTIELPQGTVNVVIGEPEKGGCLSMLSILIFLPILLLLRS